MSFIDIFYEHLEAVIDKPIDFDIFIEYQRLVNSYL